MTDDSAEIISHSVFSAIRSRPVKSLEKTGLYWVLINTFFFKDIIAQLTPRALKLFNEVKHGPDYCSEPNHLYNQSEQHETVEDFN